ncbi:MAG: DHH family phosphoesterase [Patescibacteria group bacterium]|nr:DHH family phosphoesterase [Patescibacteria group bacterium]
MDIQAKFTKSLEMMRSAERILIIAHLRPDGDALSSVAALRVLAITAGKEAVGFCQDKNQALFDYLPGFKEIEGDFNALKDKFGIKESLRDYFDLLIVADCGSLARTAISAEIIEFKKRGGNIIEFDHHPRIDDYADLEIRYPELSSTAELIYNFIVANKLSFTRDLADCILTGILTDTGNFLYPSASDATMKAASAALAAGAHYNKIVSYVLRNKDMVMMKMWGLALERLKLNPRYQLAFAVITRDDIRNILDQDNLDSAAESDFFSGLAGFLSNLSGAKAVMLLYEDRRGLVKGSLRSTPNGMLVDKLARALGGGGHERAAGFALPGKLELIDNRWMLVCGDN